MAGELNTKATVVKNSQFYQGDLGFDKNNNDKVIIYKILTGKKLEVCKIIIDEPNHILKISTKTEIINEDEFEIYTFALEADTADFILKLIAKNQINAEINYAFINNIEDSYNISESDSLEEKKKKIRKLF
ncbi:hypothetical protein [Spiroplasma ixodetis]|uniref:hypothetical protein n=1 Tax=Spiroplasma ixodetis TaxID=2141 RepID=UPI002577CB0A|nr:hypothetical protein [Spiroplasma ixodetis]WJG69610.1 hypothetical protein SIXOD_v1c05150 [Spiroplasma ixodetis Y32]